MQSNSHGLWSITWEVPEIFHLRKFAAAEKSIQSQIPAKTIFIVVRNHVNTSMLHILTVVQLLIPRMWKSLACVGDAGV